MNKKFKVVSSLTLAGMMALSSFSLSKTFAADVNDTIKTNPIGVYRDLVKNKEGKSVPAVPFVLVGKNDVVSVKEIIGSDEFNNVTKFNDTNISVVNPETTVKTGDTFVADGETFTVIIYGDVNKDGSVNSRDSKMVQEYSAKINTNFDEIQVEAADVDKNDGNINSRDSKAIRDFSTKLRDTVIDPVPEKEVSEAQYTVELTDKYVNNRNESEVPGVIKIKTPLTEEVKAKIVKVKADGTYDAEPAVDSVILKTDVVKQDITGLDCSGFDEGKTTLKLIAQKEKVKDADQEVFATFTVDKHTKEIANADIAQVKAIRDNSKEASVSFETFGDSNIVKMYYDKIKNMSTTFSDIKTATDEALAEYKSIDITNNKVENQKVYTDLVKGSTYKMNYLLVDEYGSAKAFATNKAIDITKDGITSTATAVKSVTIADINGKTATESANVEWTLEDDSVASKKFVVTLYNGTKVVATKDVTATGADKKYTKKIKDIDTTFVTAMKKAGTYKISVYTKGDASTNPSATVESNTVTVEALKAVTDITFNVNEKGERVLTWNSEYADADIEGYKVKLVKFEDGTELTLNSDDVITGKTYTIDKANKDNSYEDDKVYKAVVTVVPKDDISKAVSEEAESKDFFSIGESTVSFAESKEKSVKTNSVELKINPLIKIANKTTTYKVEVWERTEGTGVDQAKYKNTGITKTVTPDEDGKFVVDGLTAGHTYIFKMLVDVEGIQGVSQFVPSTEVENGITMKKTIPALENLTVLAKNAKTVAAGQIAETDNGINIGGTEFKTDEFGQYPDELKSVADLIKTSDVEEEDVITYTPEKLTIKLNKALNRTFTDAVKDMIVELDGSPKNEIKVLATNTEMKELILKGSTAMYDISELTIKSDANTKITVQDGVEIVKTKYNVAQKLTIATGATVTVNNVKITTAQEMIITAYDYSTTMTITVTKDNTATTNNLTFENSATKEIKIVFEGQENYDSSLNGTISLVSKGAKISIDTTNMSVKSTMDVTVEKGEVDISDDSFTGNKTVNVTIAKDASATKVTVKPAIAIPEDILTANIEDYELKELDEENLKKETKLNSYLSDDADNTKTKKVKAFLDSFGLNDKGVKLSTSNDKDTVTLTFSDEGTYTIANAALNPAE